MLVSLLYRELVLGLVVCGRRISTTNGEGPGCPFHFRVIDPRGRPLAEASVDEHRVSKRGRIVIGLRDVAFAPCNLRFGRKPLRVGSAHKPQELRSN